MINGHGNNLYDYPGKIVADFSSNIAFNHRASAIQEHLKGCLESITNYPDPSARLLTEKLARHHGVSPAHILVTNGSAEAFYLVAHLFRQAQTLICTPAFAEYEDACRVFDHRISFYPLAKLEAWLLPDKIAGETGAPRLSKASGATQTCDPSNLSEASGATQAYDPSAPEHSCPFRTLWLGTPNNPDGRLTSPETLQAICREYPNTYVIADRAYYTLTGTPAQQPLPPKSTITRCEAQTTPHPNHLADPHPNLLSIHSLTKAFAIPGLRLGYVVASPELISRLTQMRPPWGVNALSLEAGSYILDHYNTLMPAMEELLTESRFLQASLSQIAGLEVIPSSCNFFLCKLQHMEAAQIKEHLINQYGILIRDCSNFRGLDRTYFRISAQTRQKNESLIQAMRKILAS